MKRWQTNNLAIVHHWTVIICVCQNKSLRDRNQELVDRNQKLTDHNQKLEAQVKTLTKEKSAFETILRKLQI